MKISNRKLAKACNTSRGVAMFNLPWPTDVLGQYNDPNNTLYSNEKLDQYVMDQVEPDPNVIILGGCAGRTKEGKPVIVVSIRRACDAFTVGVK